MFHTSLNVATHLVLLLLEGSLGLLESSLQLLFLHLEPPSLLVQVVDGAATVAKLVKKILDLVSKVLEASNISEGIKQKAFWMTTLFSLLTTSSCSMVSS